MAIKLPKLPFQLPPIQLSPRVRKILHYVGLVALALFVFVFALQCTFPYDRVKDRMIEAMQDKYDVTIGSVERGIWPGRVYFKAVTLRTRQSNPAEAVTTFYIKEVEVNVGVMAAMFRSTIAVDLEAEIGAGEMTGSIRMEKFGRGDTDIVFEGEELPGANLPMRALIGLPMTGKMQFYVNLHLPVDKNKMGRTATNWQKAQGSISLGCPSGCTFGDGKTKLKPLVKNTRQQAMVAEGIDFGKVTMDSLSVKVAIGRGKLTVEKFETKSKDGEVKVDFTMNLDKEFNESMVAGCLRFKPSDTLMTREPKTHAALSTTGAERRADGFFHIRLTDRFKDMKRLNQECGPGGTPGSPSSGDNFARDMRPGLTVQPDQGSATPAQVPTPPITNDGGVPTVGGSAAPSGSGSAGSATATPPPGAMQNEGAAAPGKLPAQLQGSGEGSGHGSAATGSSTNVAAPQVQ